MKSFKDYILEAEEDNESVENTDEKNSDEKTTQRGNIKFTIWKEPDKKVTWLNGNEPYQKIEYKYEDKDKHISIHFLLGYVKEKDTWELWIGKIGAISYDDDPYCDLKCDEFSSAIIAALEKVEEFIKEVKDNPENWIQYYKDI